MPILRRRRPPAATRARYIARQHRGVRREAEARSCGHDLRVKLGRSRAVIVHRRGACAMLVVNASFRVRLPRSSARCNVRPGCVERVVTVDLSTPSDPSVRDLVSWMYSRERRERNCAACTIDPHVAGLAIRFTAASRVPGHARPLRQAPVGATTAARAPAGRSRHRVRHARPELPHRERHLGHARRQHPALRRHLERPAPAAACLRPRHHHTRQRSRRARHAERHPCHRHG